MCVCVCVCESERERERDLALNGAVSHTGVAAIRGDDAEPKGGTCVGGDLLRSFLEHNALSHGGLQIYLGGDYNQHPYP